MLTVTRQGGMRVSPARLPARSGHGLAACGCTAAIAALIAAAWAGVPTPAPDRQAAHTVSRSGRGALMDGVLFQALLVMVDRHAFAPGDVDAGDVESQALRHVHLQVRELAEPGHQDAVAAVQGVADSRFPGPGAR